MLPRNKIEQLDHNDPFTPQENRALSKRDRFFIRDIQVIKGISKQEAKEIFGNSNLNGTTRQLARDVRKGVKAKYPKQQFDYEKREVHKGFVKPKTKEEKIKIAKNKKNLIQWQKEVRNETRLWLQSEKTKRSKRYQSILTQKKKYPDAVKYELQHGVMSRASQDYREKHGMKRQYTGRTR